MRRSLFLLFLFPSLGFAWTQDPISYNVTQPKAVDVTELRTGIDALRSTYGFPAYTYTNVSPANPMSATDINQLRSAVNELTLYYAYGNACINAPYPRWTDDPVVGATDGTGTLIRGPHIEQLRLVVDGSNYDCNSNSFASCCSVCGYCDGTNGCSALPAGSGCATPLATGTCDGLGNGEPHCL